jgi:beta-lactamase class A
VGVIFTKPSSPGNKGPIIVSAFTYNNQDQSWTPDNEGEVVMAKLAQEIVDSWVPR